MIGTLRSTVVDCREPMRLATFYAGVLGGQIEKQDDSLGGAHRPAGPTAGVPVLAGTRAAALPDPRGSQQFHLDIRVDDPDAAEHEVLDLGATRVSDAEEDSKFRVFRDPAGHTFCLVWGIAD
ncbi:VOC family protein [Mycolicibacterium novocastrense]|nr:VOC family protein [Mycolicibacterium novocastrense]